jgi:UDPglucose--hexose-1-phosphate uridylyltransferase
MSELRQDPISRDWVIIAPGRSARPKLLDAPKHVRVPGLKEACPFEDPTRSGNEKIINAWPDQKKWRVLVMPNKYPAVSHDDVTTGKPLHAKGFHHGMYYAKTGVGEHDLIVTRDHDKNFADIDLATAVKVFEFMQDHYHAAMKDGCSEYVVPFFNWGATAGASIWHPHYQIMSLPAVPAHTVTSLENAKRYFAKHKRCIRCDVVTLEQREGTRIVAENAGAIAIAPYAPKMQFEVAVMPKRHSSYFRDASVTQLRDVAAVLQSVMKQLRKNANDPDLNFFIHDAPLGPKKYAYHHWHIEVLPRVSTPAGFEFSTGMYINTVPPEKAAEILRGRVDTKSNEKH